MFCRQSVTHVWVLLTLVSQAMACAPGRSGYQRRVPRRLTPLVVKQYVPNTAEQNEIAAGRAKGAISRTSMAFRKLVPNYNTDIRFLDDEGTGADRIMTQRCRDKLDTLAVSVMTQWPGVKLRVIESWDEYSHHKSGSLHYEGRAVDFTTDDRHQAKYGMLARLAVEAGFDWVYYETKRHVHASVKPDSINERKTASCFERSSIVQTRNGPRPMSALRIQDEVLSYNSDEGILEYSPVITFLDRDPTRKELFIKIKTEFGEQLILTRYHLVYRQEYDERPSVTYAARILPGDKILVLPNVENVTSPTEFADSSEYAKAPLGKLRPTKVLAVHYVRSRGVYAPLTTTGTIVVNGVVSSCYALVNDHQLAHRAFAPIRLLYKPMFLIRQWLSWLREIIGNKQQQKFDQKQDKDAMPAPSETDRKKPSPLGKFAQALFGSLPVNATDYDVESVWTTSSDFVRADGEDLDDPVDEYTASFRGVHWYAALLYYLFQSTLTSYMP